MPKNMKSARKGRKAKKVSDSTALTASSFVPRPNFGAHHFLGVTTQLRRTIVWAGTSYIATSSENFVDFQQIRVNDAYSPDTSIFSSSATGYAKYMEFYTKCCVRGLRLNVSFAIEEGEVGTPALAKTAPTLVGVVFTNTATPLGSFSDAVDNGLQRWRMLSSSASNCSFSLGLDVGKFLGVADLLDSSSAFSTASASVSNISSIWAHLWYRNQGTVGGRLAFGVELEMDCTFTDPKQFD